MSNVIRFLETAGRKPLSSAEFATIVALLDADSDQKQALLDHDSSKLAHLMGEDRDLCCLIVVPDEG